MERSAVLFAAVSLLTGCSPALRVAVGRQSPPVAEPAPYLQHTTCPRSQVPFDEAARRMKEGPPAIPGDDGSSVRLSLVDASHTFDLVRVSIEVEAVTGAHVLYVSDEQEAVTQISVPAGVAPTLRVHAIVRPAVDHGMFRNVSVCFDKWATFALRETESEIPLKLEDGDEASAPGQWSIFRVDTFHLRPSQSSDHRSNESRWEIERIEHIEHRLEPRD